MPLGSRTLEDKQTFSNVRTWTGDSRMRGGTPPCSSWCHSAFSGPLCHAAWVEWGQHKHNLRYLLAYDVEEGRGVISDANLAIAPGRWGEDINDPFQRVICNGLYKHLHPRGGNKTEKPYYTVYDPVICPVTPRDHALILWGELISSRRADVRGWAVIHPLSNCCTSIMNRQELFGVVFP